MIEGTANEGLPATNRLLKAQAYALRLQVALVAAQDAARSLDQNFVTTSLGIDTRHTLELISTAAAQNERIRAILREQLDQGDTK